jgi:hypothetical protein
VVARKHHKNDVRVVIAQRAETVKVLLTSSVPKRELDGFGRVDRVRDDGDKVLEHGRDIGLVRASEWQKNDTRHNVPLGSGSRRTRSGDRSCHSLGSR